MDSNIIRVIDSPQFTKGILTKNVRRLMNLFLRNDYEIRIIGGAVRDLLRRKYPPNDVDFATTATTQTMANIFNSTSDIHFKQLNNPRHLTLLAIFPNGEKYEVTSLQRDYYRSYGDIWEDDAGKRDFTINAMSLDKDGNVYDYLSGFTDLMTCRINFCSLPNNSLSTDPFRILRYFRFCALLKPVHEYDHDSHVLDVIENNACDLKYVHGSRIWNEFKKMLTHKSGCELLLTFLITCSGSTDVGLPHPDDLDLWEFRKICKQSHKWNLLLEPICKICALLTDEDDLYTFSSHIGLSKDNLRLGLFILRTRDNNGYQYSFDKFVKMCLLETHGYRPNAKRYGLELCHYWNNIGLYRQLQNWN